MCVTLEFEKKTGILIISFVLKLEVFKLSKEYLHART